MGFALIFFAAILIIIIFVLIYVEIYHKYSRTARLINKLPGPKTLPVIGNALAIIDNPVGLFNKFRAWSKQYYPVYRLWSSNAYPAVLIWTPDDLQTILSNPKHNEKSTIYLFFHEWLGEGLLTANGEKWQQRRKILTSTFHFNILKRYVPIFNKHSASFVQDLSQELNKDEFNVLPHIHKASLHTIAEAAMGTNLTDPKSEKTYRESIHRIGDIIVYRIMRPWFYFVITHLFSKQFYEERRILRYLKSFTKKVIDDREATFKESDVEDAYNNDEDDTLFTSGKKRKCLAMLDLLLSAKNRQEIDYDGIREEVDTFMFEGHDTISMSLSFTCMLLANHPEIQQRVYEEISEILDNNRAPTYEDLQRMTYMEMMIKESLRLYPSVPIISRVNNEDFVTSTGHVVPKGTTLVINIFDTHRLAEYYPQPERFIPERFSQANAKDRHPYAYVPFSAGSRNCIGLKYAMMNMKCKIAALLQAFVLLPVDTPETIVLMTDIILRTKDGIKIKLKSR